MTEALHMSYKDLDTTKQVFPYLLCVITFKTAIFLFELYLDFRQYKKFTETEMPKDIKSFVEQKFFNDSQSYNRDVKHFGIIKSVFYHVYEVFTLYFTFVALVWESDYVLSYLGLDPNSEVYRAYFTFLCLYVISTVVGIPWSLYMNFVIKEKHGFNSMTLKIFVMDLIKSTLIVSVLILILTPLIIKIIEYGGENFYIYLFVFIVILTFVMMWIVPNFIMPLFNKYDEIEEGELKKKIYQLADDLKFPLKKLFVVDESMRSTQSNAYFFGFGSNKRIVLFDNLLKHLETDEIVAVVGHELGHWKLNHTIVNLVYGFASLFITFYVFSFVIHRDDILIDFGFSRHYNIVSLLVFSEVFTPVDYIERLIQTSFTRVLEFQADEFANDLGYKRDLMRGLIRLYIKNKANLNPDSLYAKYHFSHPELIERLRALGDFQNVITPEEIKKGVEKAEDQQKEENQQKLTEDKVEDEAIDTDKLKND